MSFLLKIVQGPNAGAEIALVDGLTVTFGKADSCDIVLADPTLPDQPFQLAATAGGVTLDGEPLEPLHVRKAGSTAFAVGPAESVWGELVWPEPPRPERAEAPEPAAPTARPETSENPENPERPAAGRRHGCFGCLVALVILLFLLAALAWFFRKPLAPYYHEKVEPHVAALWGKSEELAKDKTGEAPLPATIEQVADRYALTLTNRDNQVVLSGNLATRAERLTATAACYAVDPSVELDLTDNESMRTMGEDTLAMMGEERVRVTTATNRVLALAGKIGTETTLKKILESLAVEIPRLENVDCGEIILTPEAIKPSEVPAPEAPAAPVRTIREKKREAGLPVCGILTVPYPCLVLKNGTRLLEGAQIGDSTILKIEPDAVTLTNETGRFTWKP
ncbi:MAG: hypothetical protein J6334_06950 [Kiritimatiellae bacterium]|nr:hypothetical protein [Kiritimatiellia bacterium]